MIDSYNNLKSESSEYERIEPNISGGISQELVTDNHRNLCNELICSICLEIVRTPKLCKNCQNLFCNDCLKTQLTKSKFCPNRCLYVEQEVNLIFKKLLFKIEFKCYYHLNGCKETITYEYFNKHIKNCIFGDFKCLSPGCNEIKNLDGIKDHILTCNLRLVECKFCQKNIAKKDISYHIDECSNKLTKCDFCNNSFKNKIYINHKNECDEYILICCNCDDTFKRKDKKLHTETVCLKNQVSFWKNKYNLSLKEINELNQRLQIYNYNCLERLMGSGNSTNNNNVNNALISRLISPNKEGNIIY